MARRKNTSECLKEKVDHSQVEKVNDFISKLADKCSIFLWSNSVYKTTRDYLKQETEKYAGTAFRDENNPILIMRDDEEKRKLFFILKNSNTRPFETNLSNMISFPVACPVKTPFFNEGELTRVPSGVCIMDNKLYLADYRDPMGSSLDYKYISYDLNDLEYITFSIKDTFSFEIYIKGLFRNIQRYMEGLRSSFEEAFLLSTGGSIDDIMLRTIASLEVDVSLKFKDTFGEISFENLLNYTTGYTESKLHFLRYLLKVLIGYEKYDPENEEIISPYDVILLLERANLHKNVSNTVWKLYTYQDDFKHLFNMLNTTNSEK